MNRKLIAMSAAVGVLALGAATASADTTVIGSVGQSSNQAVNSSQSGENGSGAGNTFILGDSAPTTVQTSANVLVNDQEIGGGTGDTTLIAPAATQCFCQSSNQGANSQQVAVNGDGGAGTTFIGGDSAPTLVQDSANVLDNGQFIGGGAGDTILIGGAAQANTQGVNSTQSGSNGSGGSGFLVVGDDSLGLLDQTSANVLTNVVVLGG
ncbi:MAG TPA: hypothetical protein VFR49_01565 [Solirubrobacteraceae bacterium]|nr:hypothetical protein [Solirubrobacteraceae bacterium]